MPIPVALIVAGASAIYKGAKGAKQKSDGKAKGAGNKRPDFDIEDEYYNNQSIAENQAGQGFTSRTVSNFNSQNERGLQSSIDAYLQGGAGPNSLQGALATYNAANNNFASADAEKQTANISTLYERNADLAKQKVQQWTINKYKPFLDTAAASAAEVNAGEQNISTAFAEGTSALASYAASKEYEKMLEKHPQVINPDGTKTNTVAPPPTYKVSAAVTPSNTSSDYERWLRTQGVEDEEAAGLSPEDEETLKLLLAKRKKI